MLPIQMKRFLVCARCRLFYVNALYLMKIYFSVVERAGLVFWHQLTLKGIRIGTNSSKLNVLASELSFVFVNLYLRLLKHDSITPMQL